MQNPLAHRTGPVSKTPEANDLDYMLVDGSASMQAKWWNFLTAGDVFLDESRKNGVKSHLVVHVFDTEDMEMIQRDEPLATAKTFAEEPLGSHFGGTPLYDAIVLMGMKLKERNPTKASIIIITDGDDLDSKTKISDAKRVLDWCRAKGWQVTFIGCDFNNEAQAAMLGANASNTIGVDRKLLSAAARNLATKRAAYSRDGENIAFTDDEKKKFGGYLTDGTK
jgi:nitric oxide reductase activation protein